MPKLVLQNCQRIVELTEFDLDGLGFLVGPNNSGKGVVKDALEFLSAFFKGDKKTFIEQEKNLFRNNVQPLSFEEMSTYRPSDQNRPSNEIPINFLTPEFNHQSCRKIGFEFDVTDPFITSPDSQYSDDQGSYEWDQIFTVGGDPKKLHPAIGKKMLMLYEDLPYLTQSGQQTSFTRFSIWCEDKCILHFTDCELASAQVVLDFQHLAELGDIPFEEQVKPSSGWQLKTKNGIPHSLVENGKDQNSLPWHEIFYYYINSEYLVLYHPDLFKGIWTGRFNIPTGYVEVEWYFSSHPEESLRLRGLTGLLERLCAYCKIKIDRHCKTYSISGNRHLPTKDSLRAIFNVKDEIEMLINRWSSTKPPYLGPDKEKQDRAELSEESALWEWLITDTLFRSKWLKNILVEQVQSMEFSSNETVLADDKQVTYWDLPQSDSVINRVNHNLRLLCGIARPPNLVISFKITDLPIDLGKQGLQGTAINKATLEGFIHLESVTGFQVGFEQVGSAIGYVLPVLILLENQNPSLVGFIEQPELHLHPKMQGDLGELFFHTAGKQFPVFVETHSENLILRVLRKIRENYRESIRFSIQDPSQFSNTLQGKDVRFYYFQPVDETSTRVHSLNVSPSGHFYEPWPDGFFEERDADLDSLL